MGAREKREKRGKRKSWVASFQDFVFVRGKKGFEKSS